VSDSTGWGEEARREGAKDEYVDGVNVVPNGRGEKERRPETKEKTRIMWGMVRGIESELLIIGRRGL